MQQFLEKLAGIFGFSIARYFIVAGLAFILFYTFFSTRLVKSKIQARTAGRKDFLREIKHSISSTLIFSLIGLFVFLSPIARYTLIYRNLSDYPLWWVPVSLVLSLVIHDTYFYWMHRLLHHKRLFKYAHVLHHKSTNPSPWASYSFHVFESVTEGLVLLVVAMVLPMHPLTIFLFVLVGFIINVYGHLGYEIMPKGFRRSVMFEVLNTSVHHNLHHSKFKGNYGLYFRVWDRVCKTEHPDYVKDYDRVQEQRFGKAAAVDKLPAPKQEAA